MANDRFQASVQYDDLTGTAAADRPDGKSGPEDWLKKKGLMNADEFVLGIELYSGESPGVHRDPVTVHFLLVPGAFDSAKEMVGKSSAAVQTRRVTVDMKLAEFMGLFKRFSVCVSPGGMLSGKRYKYDDEHRE